jgi:hypothetical protein
MASVTMCDRCKAVDVQVVPVLGSDLCNRCIGEFRVWVRTAPRADGTAPSIGGKRRTPHGMPARIARQLIIETGEVTPDSYGRVTDKSYRDAYLTLNHLERRGVLVRKARADAVVSYVLPRAEAAE